MQLTQFQPPVQVPAKKTSCTKPQQQTDTNFTRLSIVFPCLSTLVESTWTAPSTPASITPLMTTASKTPHSMNEGAWWTNGFINSICVSLPMAQHETSTNHKQSKICFERICTGGMDTEVHTLFTESCGKAWRRMPLKTSSKSVTD